MPANEQTIQTITSPTESVDEAHGPQPASMVAVSQLTEHPGNVRADGP
jgi:hypothetical protein